MKNKLKIFFIFNIIKHGCNNFQNTFTTIFEKFWITYGRLNRKESFFVCVQP